MPSADTTQVEAVEVSRIKTVPAPNPALIEDLIDDLLGEEQAARTAALENRVPGPSTGWKEFDREVGGFLAPEVHTLLAAPGAGKTAWDLERKNQAQNDRANCTSVELRLLKNRYGAGGACFPFEFEGRVQKLL